jgi:hypothetical protein
MEEIDSIRLNRIIGTGADCEATRFRVRSLGDFLSLLESLLTDADPVWYRGHAQHAWTLQPSALRIKDLQHRKRILGDAFGDFKRFTSLKFPNPPDLSNNLHWMQLAQHHGLPTRLLDWSENPVIGLFFACEVKESADATTDAVVYILKPRDLNRNTFKSKAKILEYQTDKHIIDDYISVKGQTTEGTKSPLAVNPIWNSERLSKQQGAFTLHGTKARLDRIDAPTLMKVPILHEDKRQIRMELDRCGIHEMAIFPEPEYTCKFICRKLRSETE